MKNRVIRIVVGSILIGSLALNVVLFLFARAFYLGENYVRLNPLGLEFYPTSAEVDPNKPMLVMLGDSRIEAWPAPMRDDMWIVNRGIGGQTSTQIRYRYEAHVRPHQPDILLIQLGINDLKTIPLFPNQESEIVSTLKENIDAILDEAARDNVTVILTTIFPTGPVPLERRLFWSDRVDPAVLQVNAYIREKESETVFVYDAHADLLGEGLRIDPIYSRDQLHLNTAGYDHLNLGLTPFLDAATNR